MELNLDESTCRGLEAVARRHVSDGLVSDFLSDLILSFVTLPSEVQDEIMQAGRSVAKRRTKDQDSSEGEEVY